MVRVARALAMSVAILDIACSGSSYEELPGGVKRVTLTGSGTGDGDGWSIARATLADDDADGFRAPFEPRPNPPTAEARTWLASVGAGGGEGS
jgi:hypothetical protein